MKEDCEGRWKRKTKDEEEEVARLSHSLSTSVLVGISDSCSVVEMTSQTHYRLGAKPKWSAHVGWPYMTGGESSRSRQQKQLKG